MFNLSTNSRSVTFSSADAADLNKDGQEMAATLLARGKGKQLTGRQAEIYKDVLSEPDFQKTESTEG